MMIVVIHSLGPGRLIRMSQVHTHLSRPSEKSGNSIAIWLVEELAEHHNVAAKDV